MAATIRFLNPQTLAKPPGYTNVVETTELGRSIYFAGQLELDLDNNLVGAPDDFRSQCERAFENPQFALAAVGAGFKDMVKINSYLVEIGSNMAHFRAVRDRFLTAPPPASTTVGVPEMARPGALFEIEAVAVLPEKSASKTRAKPAAPWRGRRKVKRGKGR